MRPIKFASTTSWRALPFLLAALLIAGCSPEPKVKGGDVPREVEILDFSADPLEIHEGETSTLSWLTAGASSVVVSDGESTIYESEEFQNDLVEVTPQRTTTYTLVASGRGGTAEATVRVEVIPEDVTPEPPSIVSFTSDRGASLIEPGETVTLSWSVLRANSLDLSGNGVAISLEDRSLGDDSIELVVHETTEYVLVATNEDGEDRRSLTVTTAADDSMELAFFRAIPSRVAMGEEFELEWESRGAIRFELFADGALIHDAEDETTDRGSLRQNIARDTVYELVLFSAADRTLEAELLVSVGAPEIVSFGPQRQNHRPDAPVEFHWESDGGATLQLLGPSGEEPSCATTDPHRIAVGSCTLTTPDEVGSFTYTLVVQNGAGAEDRREATIHVVDGPPIVAFEVSSSSIDEGGTVVFSWRTEPDGQGVIATLSLTDDQGNPPYSLDGLDPEEDSLEVELSQPGTYEFTLTAATPGTTPTTRSISVTVHPAATVSLSAAPPIYDPATSDSVLLSWSSSGAVALSIFALDDAGGRIEPAVHTASTPSEIESGSLTLDPWDTTTYVAVVSNANGSEWEASLEIEVIFPRILTFDADPRDILENGFTRLSWTTENAEGVTLEPLAPYSVREANLPYLRLSESGAAKQLPHNEGTCGGKWPPACATLDFPPEFQFPYDGETYRSLKVFSAGIVSLDPKQDSTIPSPSEETLPIPTNPRGSKGDGWTEMIAPFWTRWGTIDPDDKKAGIFYELREDPSEGKFLVIEWSGFKVDWQEPPDWACGPVNVNLVLWQSGRFDFRYDVEEKDFKDFPGANCHGYWSEIGFQYRGGEEGISVSTAGLVPVGGLANRSYSFSPSEPGPNGGLDLSLRATETFTLTVHGAGGRSSSETVTVSTYPELTVAALVEPAVVFAGSHATIAWKTTHTHSVRVVDESGATVCEDNALLRPNGACSVGRSEVGEHVYELIATNPAIEKRVSVPVRFSESLSIQSLTVTPDELPYDAPGPVTVSWTATGASSFKLFANGEDITGQASASDPNTGAATITPSATTEFTLEVFGSDGVRQARSRSFTLRTFSKNSI